jgi:hypothetical protein
VASKTIDIKTALRKLGPLRRGWKITLTLAQYPGDMHRIDCAIISSHKPYWLSENRFPISMTFHTWDANMARCIDKTAKKIKAIEAAIDAAGKARQA